VAYSRGTKQAWTLRTLPTTASTVTPRFALAPGLLALGIVTAAFSVAFSLYAHQGRVLEGPVMLWWNLLFRLALCWWVWADRRSLGVPLPFEFDAFVFFAWFFAAPYYFVKTRGPKGWLTAPSVFAFALIPLIISSFVRVFAAR
jgi:hypothetical protein